MSKATNVIVGFLAGAAAGVLTGVLIAPTKGSRTRRKIKNKMKDVTQSVAETIAEQIDHLETQIRHLKRDAEKGAGKVKTAASKIEREVMADANNMM